MKYKLKFEITFPDMDKSDEREAKINLISSEITTEIESDYPIQPPSEKSIITLGDVEYEVVIIRHKLDKYFYTTICYVVNVEYSFKKDYFIDSIFFVKEIDGEFEFDQIEKII
jgi:hypothetical protein